MNQVSSDRMNVSRLVWQHRKMSPVKHNNLMTTLNGGSLGSCIDEERSQLRYVMWIAEISESSNFWTQIALLGPPGSMSVWVSRTPMLGALILRAIYLVFDVERSPEMSFSRTPLWGLFGRLSIWSCALCDLTFFDCRRTRVTYSETLGQPWRRILFIK